MANGADRPGFAHPASPSLGLAVRKALGRLLEELGHGDKSLTLILTNDAEIQALKRAYWG